MKKIYQFKWGELGGGGANYCTVMQAMNRLRKIANWLGGVAKSEVSMFSGVQYAIRTACIGTCGLNTDTQYVQYANPEPSKFTKWVAVARKST